MLLFARKFAKAIRVPLVVVALVAGAGTGAVLAPNSASAQGAWCGCDTSQCGLYSAGVFWCTAEASRMCGLSGDGSTCTTTWCDQIACQE